MDYQQELEKFNGELKPVMEMFFEFTKNAAITVYKILDANIDKSVMMFSNHLILGDTMEAPQDWFGKVFTLKSGEKALILSMTSKLTNLDLMFQQAKSLHRKTYGGW